MRKIEECKCIGSHKITTPNKTFWLSYCTLDLPSSTDSHGQRAFTVFEQLAVGQSYLCISTAKGYVLVED